MNLKIDKRQGKYLVKILSSVRHNKHTPQIKDLNISTDLYDIILKLVKLGC